MTQSLTDFVGRTIVSVSQTEDEIVFTTDDGRWFMNHQQDCCEMVTIEDIDGDLQNIVGGQVIIAEERASQDAPEDARQPQAWRDDSETWTFYTIRTTRGDVTIRWYGSSNGYYSESVDFYKEGTRYRSW